ncbi:predicted protein [Chaetoceros tenuissimus]|uniref:Uncharacterized protein n=1 Tax=Chaetoceros tenuissimus TaxID=426638 RepID=A0AAD3CY44_9STRA|nr:predicted protein [Chaetoceros tenuissimus]
MIVSQFAVRTIAHRRCSWMEAMAICVRVNVAGCNRYLHRKSSKHNELNILQELSLPCALRTLDTHLVFHAAHFERHVKAFEKQHDCSLAAETFEDIENEYPIKRIDVSTCHQNTRDHNEYKFLSEFLMNALFIRLTGATKYLVSLMKNEDTVLPGMDLNCWEKIFKDVVQMNKTICVNTQWTSGVANIPGNIPRIMHSFHKVLTSYNQKDIFSNRYEMFETLHHSVGCEFVSSLIVADTEEFFTGLWDDSEINFDSVKSGHGGTTGIAIIHDKKAVTFDAILKELEQCKDDNFMSLLGFERQEKNNIKFGVFRNVCNGRPLSLVDVEHFSCKIFLFCDHSFGNRTHFGTNTNTKVYLHPIEFLRSEHPEAIVNRFNRIYEHVADKIIRCFEEYSQGTEWEKLKLPRPFHNGQFIPDFSFTCAVVDKENSDKPNSKDRDIHDMDLSNDQGSQMDDEDVMNPNPLYAEI